MEQPPRAPEGANQEPEPEQITRALFEVEERLNQAGWDQPPVLLALNRPDDEQIGVRPLIAPTVGIHPARMMQDAAAILRNPTIRSQLPAALGSGYFGLVVSWEGWGRFGAGLLTRDPNRRLADQPGSIEVRGLFVRTVGGHEQSLLRARGQRPNQLELPADGRIVDELRSLMDVIENLRQRP